MEKLWIISYFEMMLLVRKRKVLIYSLLASLAGGILFSLSGRSEYGLLLVLPVSSLLMARETDLRARIGQTMRTGLPSVTLSHIAASIALLPFLLALSILYIVTTLMFRAGYPNDPVIPGSAFLLALIAGFTAKSTANEPGG